MGGVAPSVSGLRGGCDFGTEVFGQTSGRESNPFHAGTAMGLKGKSWPLAQMHPAFPFVFGCAGDERKELVESRLERRHLAPKSNWVWRKPLGSPGFPGVGP
jgi:hypothetical protein